MSRNGYARPVRSRFCMPGCEPGFPTMAVPGVNIADLKRGAGPSVVLHLLTGGASCCDIVQVFSRDPHTRAYTRTERNFGDGGVGLLDLGHNGLSEFVGQHFRFGYAFSDYPAAGRPVEVLAWGPNGFTDVTRSYPPVIRRDALGWMRLFRQNVKDRYRYNADIAAAWAADEAMLDRFLRKHGFLRRRDANSWRNQTVSSASFALVDVTGPDWGRPNGGGPAQYSPSGP